MFAKNSSNSKKFPLSDVSKHLKTAILIIEEALIQAVYRADFNFLKIHDSIKKLNMSYWTTHATASN